MRILDTYSVPSYISSSPISTLKPPVMYLQTALEFAKSNVSNHVSNISFALRPWWIGSLTRYISQPATSSSLSSLIPFAPPNLIQSLPASLLSMLEAKSSGYSGVLILVPSLRIHPPPPRSIPQPYPSNEFWAEGVLKIANEALQGKDGISSSSSSEVGRIPWDPTKTHRVHGSQGTVSGRGGRPRGDVGDGGMYI